MNKHIIGWFLKGFALLAILLLVAFAIYGVQQGLAQSGGNGGTTETDKGPAGQSSGTTSDQPVDSSGVPPDQGGESTSSALDPNAPAVGESEINLNDPDVAALRPSVVPPSWVMNFKFVVGTAFHPRNSTYTWAEAPDGGCLYQVAGDTGSSTFVADLQLPDGAIVDILRLFYYDTSANDSYTWLTEYNAAGGYTDIAFITSTGNTGYGNNANSSFEYTVANYSHPILLNWRSRQLGATMQICGMRLRFWTAGPVTFMPLILK